ncbi:Polr2k [Gossypium arboreum]|uniref:Polr2k n=1 Tax=Gossypium arboreum TaxID=29729 RepID=A0A0B0NKE6_GOSAR|nr:Polr2k [Gossypium arboreum]
MDPQPEPVTYICGDCGQENTLKHGDVIQCRECGYRILYKKRTRRSNLFSTKLAESGVRRRGGYEQGIS